MARSAGSADEMDDEKKQIMSSYLNVIIAMQWFLMTIIVVM